eukprot:PhM_4_TR3602/c0_g1_i1/m.105203
MSTSPHKEREILGGHQGTKELFDKVLAAAVTFDEPSRQLLLNVREEFLSIDDNISKCVDSAGNTLLHLAIKSETRTLAFVFEHYRGEDVIDQPNNLGKTPLHEAVRNNSYMCAAMLLDHEADPGVSNSVHSKVFHTAAACGAVECVQLLLKRGVAEVDCLDRNMMTALQKACNDGSIRVAELLLNNGAKVNNADVHGATALHYAVRAGHVNIMELLLDREANIEAETAHGNTPLHEAASRGLRDVFIGLVRRGAVVNKKNEDHNTPLHLAALNFRADDKHWADFIVDVVKASGEEGLGMTNAAGKRPCDLVHRQQQHLFEMEVVRVRDAELAQKAAAAEREAQLVIDRRRILLEERRRLQEERDRLHKEDEERKKRDDDERLIQIDNARIRAEEAAEAKRLEEEAAKTKKGKKNKDKKK